MRIRMHRRGAIGIVMAVLAMSGCASRGYVQRQMTDLRSAMASANDSLRTHIRDVQGTAADASYRAAAAVHGLRTVEEMALGRVGYREVSRQSVYFARNSAEPEPASAGTLDQVAEQLFRDPQLLVELYGFTDPSGSAAHNLELGRRRTESVLRKLTAGVPGRLLRFQAISFGEELPYGDPSPGTPAERRRVQIVVLEKVAPDKAGDQISARTR
jgi:outer membrane protein OmpA-like peptidoglycan-associated protein